MLKVFEVCFYTGAIFTVVSFLMSQFGHVMGGGHTDTGDLSGHGADFGGHGGDIGGHGVDIGGHGVDIGGHGGDIGGHGVDIGAHGADMGAHGADIGSHGMDTNNSFAMENIDAPISPFKPTVISAFVTTFGGIGIILSRQSLLPIIVLIGALLSGLAAGFLLYKFVIVPLYRAQNTSAVSIRYLKGAIGKMDLSTKEKAYGKVSYTVNGNTMTSPALSWNGEEILAGTTVVVVDIKKNTFYVKEIKGV